MKKQISKVKPLTKRQLKREKERALSIMRAEKMHKLRIKHDEPLRNENLPKVNIGCSGWFYWDWQGRFYPRRLETKDWFGHYLSNFKTVELNAPFYSWPTLGRVRVWLRQAGYEEFVYTVKVNELITHIKKFEHVKNLVRDFAYIGNLLGERMGCFLFQLPPDYEYTPARLKEIVTQLDPQHRSVVEFRHESWWNEKVYKAFKKANIIFCSVSAPDLPDELIKTSDEIYIRFHGKEKWIRYDYSKRELKRWAEQIKESGAKRVWAYFNNDYNAYSTENAKLLAKLLKKF